VTASTASLTTLPRLWSRRRIALVLGCAAAIAFAGLAVLVQLGRLNAVDSFAVRHLMLSQPERVATLVGRLLSYHGRELHATQLIRLPASALPSTLLVLLACGILWRRRRGWEALLWLAAFALATAVELVCKSTIAKPALYTPVDGSPYPLPALEMSFPSGHALHSILVAAVVATVWPRLMPLSLVWVATVIVSLQLNGVHPPSDILGGILLACAAVAAVLVLRERRGWPRNASVFPGPV
jgi:undecaprenyl-diphosphatase